MVSAKITPTVGPLIAVRVTDSLVFRYKMSKINRVANLSLQFWLW